MLSSQRFGSALCRSAIRQSRIKPIASLPSVTALSTNANASRTDECLRFGNRSIQLATLVAGLALFGTSVAISRTESEEYTTLLNWSGTHAVHVPSDLLWEPESVGEVELIVKECHERGIPVRPLGSALSPNGIAFQAEGMMSMVNLDEIVAIEGNQVTVQAGARVSQVVEALRPHGLTLPNLASIAEQQMGGFVQVGAHGTGRTVAPVDHYVTKLKLVTPGRGTITLTPENGEQFQLAKVGLGCLGVVVEVTMECVPAHFLEEHTFVLTRKEALEQVDDLLQKHKHMRYMWIPYADAVVCVTNDPTDNTTVKEQRVHSEEHRFQPLTDLLMEVSANSSDPYTKQSLKGMGFGEVRDALLAVDPLDLDHVRRCNQAEAEFWRRSEGTAVKPSDQLLQFDCGGQQWVWEICFPTGTQSHNSGNDMKFMDELLEGIETKGIPAHSPIEQRWTASSSSLLSPAHGPAEGLHSWVGIINYLQDDEKQRRAVTELFTGQYCDLMRKVGSRYDATSHWAKISAPVSVWKLADLQLFLAQRFPLRKFNDVRKSFDPKNILSNPLINSLLGKP